MDDGFCSTASRECAWMGSRVRLPRPVDDDLVAGLSVTVWRENLEEAVAGGQQLASDRVAYDNRHWSLQHSPWVVFALEVKVKAKTLTKCVTFRGGGKCSRQSTSL